MKIRSLFDPKKDIYRTIEKVITYAASQENRLKAEINEYEFTTSIEEQLRKLLELMKCWCPVFTDRGKARSPSISVWRSTVGL
jgi:hypothetical protein